MLFNECFGIATDVDRWLFPEKCLRARVHQGALTNGGQCTADPTPFCGI